MGVQCALGHSFALAYADFGLPEGTEGKYEYSCRVCGEKLPSTVKLEFPKHSLCGKGEHLWYQWCQCCDPYYETCARLCGERRRIEVTHGV